MPEETGTLSEVVREELAHQAQLAARAGSSAMEAAANIDPLEDPDGFALLTSLSSSQITAAQSLASLLDGQVALEAQPTSPLENVPLIAAPQDFGQNGTPVQDEEEPPAEIVPQSLPPKAAEEPEAKDSPRAELVEPEDEVPTTEPEPELDQEPETHSPTTIVEPGPIAKVPAPPEAEPAPPAVEETADSPEPTSPETDGPPQVLFRLESGEILKITTDGFESNLGTIDGRTTPESIENAIALAVTLIGKSNTMQSVTEVKGAIGLDTTKETAGKFNSAKKVLSKVAGENIKTEGTGRAATIGIFGELISAPKSTSKREEQREDTTSSAEEADAGQEIESSEWGVRLNDGGFLMLSENRIEGPGGILTSRRARKAFPVITAMAKALAENINNPVDSADLKESIEAAISDALPASSFHYMKDRLIELAGGAIVYEGPHNSTTFTLFGELITNDDVNGVPDHPEQNSAEPAEAEEAAGVDRELINPPIGLQFDDESVLIVTDAEIRVNNQKLVKADEPVTFPRVEAVLRLLIDNPNSLHSAEHLRFQAYLDEISDEAYNEALRLAKKLAGQHLAKEVDNGNESYMLSGSRLDLEPEQDAKDEQASAEPATWEEDSTVELRDELDSAEVLDGITEDGENLQVASISFDPENNLLHMKSFEHNGREFPEYTRGLSREEALIVKGILNAGSVNPDRHVVDARALQNRLFGEELIGTRSRMEFINPLEALVGKFPAIRITTHPQTKKITQISILK